MNTPEVQVLDGTSSKIAPKAFPDCLSTVPNERDINALMVALEITNKDEYLLAIDKVVPLTLSGKRFRRAKDDNGNYVLSGNQVDYAYLLEQSKTKDIIWFPNPVDTNAYGRTSDHFKTFKNIVVECDDKSLEEQWEQVRWLSSLGLQVTSVVYTGGKSLHLYFHLKQSTDGDGYLAGKKALVMILGADTNVSLVEKSRLPGLHRPGKDYPQQLIYNTANSTTIDAILEVFRAVFNRDITDDLWSEYKLSRTGKSAISPDKVLYTPDQELPSVIERKNRELDAERRRLERLANPLSIDRENYYKSCLDAINRIDRDATLDDFIKLGFTAKRSSSKGYTVGSFNEGGKGESCAISKPKNGDCLVAHSFKGDYLAENKSSATYSQIWFDKNGYKNLTGKDFYAAAKAIAADHSIILPDAPPPPPSPLSPSSPPPSPSPSIIRTTFIPPQDSTIVNSRYLSPELLTLIPQDTKIVALKSNWGTGKSTLMKEVVNQCIADGDIYVMLSPLQSLARNSAIKLDVYYKTEYISGVKHISMCLHNLYDGSAIGARLLPVIRQHTGKIHLVFDEAECLRKGLLALDSTLSKNQLSIIDTIGELGSLPGARIWLLDADLNNGTTDFYSDCIRQYSHLDATEVIKTHWIINTYENKVRTLFQYPLVNRDGKQSNPSVVLKHVLEATKDNPDMILLATTGQKINTKTGKYSAESTANELRDNGLDGRVLVVDSETTAVEGSLAAGIIEDPSLNLKIAKDKGFKVVIFTLGIFKTGLSIEDGEDRLFSHVYVISTGLLSPELVIQSLFRYRNLDIPRYLFVKKSGFNFLAGRSMTTERAISTLNKEQNEKMHARAIDIAAPNRAASKVYWLLDQWSRVIVENNRQMTNYADSINELIKNAVETIYTVDEDEFGLNRLADPATEVEAELRQIQRDLALVNAIKVTESQDLTHREAQSLVESNKRTREQNNQINKYILQNLTGRQEITVEDVYNGDHDFFAKARLLHNGLVSLHLQPLLDKMEIMKITDGNPIRIASKVRYFKALTVRKLLELGLKDIIFSGESVSSESTSLASLIRKLVEEGLLTTTTVETKKGLATYYVSAGDLTGLVSHGKVYQSKMKCLKDLLGVLGAALVLDKNRAIRTYKVKSLWRDVDGNHCCEVVDINNSLFTHWTRLEVAAVLSHLLQKKITLEQSIGMLMNLTPQQLEQDEDFNQLKLFINEQFS